MNRTANHYLAFGSTLSSEIPIPHLQRVSAPCRRDGCAINIQTGPVEPVLIRQPELRQGELGGQLRYRIANGRDVVIEQYPDADVRNVTDLIMSRVVPIIAYQRDSLILHASAVVMDGQVLAFAGGSGAGKSTIAAALAARGHIVFSDDLLLVRCGDGTPPRAFPGATHLKLAKASLDYIGLYSAGLPLANTSEEKFLAPPHTGFPEAWNAGLPLRGLFRLGRGASLIEPARPADVFGEWRTFIRSPALFQAAARPRMIWQQWLDMISATPVFRLDRAGEFSQLPSLAIRVEETVGKVTIR